MQTEFTSKTYWTVGIAVLVLHAAMLFALSLAPVKTIKQTPEITPIELRFVTPEPKPEPPKPKIIPKKPIKQPVKKQEKKVSKPKPVKKRAEKPPVKKPVKPVKKTVTKPTPPKKTVQPPKKQPPKKAPPKQVKKVIDPTVIAAQKAAEEAELLAKQQAEAAEKAALKEEALRKAAEEKAAAEKRAQEKAAREAEEKAAREAEEKAAAEAKEAKDAKAAKEAAQQKANGVTIDASYNHRAEPKYPRKELSRNNEGSVSFVFTIDTKGKAKNIRVTQSTSAAFKRAATKALKASTFNVQTIDGVAVEQKARTTIEFTL